MRCSPTDVPGFRDGCRATRGRDPVSCDDVRPSNSPSTGFRLSSPRIATRHTADTTWCSPAATCRALMRLNDLFRRSHVRCGLGPRMRDIFNPHLTLFLRQPSDRARATSRRSDGQLREVRAWCRSFHGEGRYVILKRWPFAGLDTLQENACLTTSKFGVSDYAASKAFFLKALEPLGVAVVAEGTPTYGVELCPKEGKVVVVPVPNGGESRRIFTWRSWPRPAGKSTLSIARRWRPVAKDNGAPGPAPELQPDLLCRFRHRPGRAQHRSGLSRSRGLTVCRHCRPRSSEARAERPENLL